MLDQMNYQIYIYILTKLQMKILIIPLNPPYLILITSKQGEG